LKNWILAVLTTALYLILFQISLFTAWPAVRVSLPWGSSGLFWGTGLSSLSLAIIVCSGLRYSESTQLRLFLWLCLANGLFLGGVMWGDPPSLIG
jgi:hypothetical protein